MFSFNKNGNFGVVALALVFLCAFCFAQDLSAEAVAAKAKAETARAEANEAARAAADAAEAAAKAKADADAKAAIAKKKPKVKAVVKAKIEAAAAAKAAEAKAAAAATNAADAEVAAKLAEAYAEKAMEAAEAQAEEKAKADAEAKAAAEEKAAADAAAMAAETEAAAKAAAEGKPVAKPAEPTYKSYEDYLDSLVVYSKAVQPVKDTFENRKVLIRQETPKPKDQYEKQADYDYRIANFDKDKQKRIDALEKEYKAEAKNKKNKLSDAINYKDIQPNWEGIFRQDTTILGYEARAWRLTDKIGYMKGRTAQVHEILSSLDLLSKGDLETLEKNNRIYLARLERARELMKNYIVTEQSKVLSTERKNFGMMLDAYDPETELYKMTMNDMNSETVPFDFVGTVKISPEEARAIENKTDDFLASVSYINFPFVVMGSNLYPGAARTDVFYKGNPVQSTGEFRNLPRLEYLEGYAEWSLMADSLISGKLVPRNLDSTYAMKREAPKAAKAPLEGTWWSRNKNIVRTTLIVLAAAGAGVGVWQNIEASNKAEDVNTWGTMAVTAGRSGNQIEYAANKAKYDDGIKKVHQHENMRNGFYIGAGVFGVAAILSFTF